MILPNRRLCSSFLSNKHTKKCVQRGFGSESGVRTRVCVTCMRVVVCRLRSGIRVVMFSCAAHGTYMEGVYLEGFITGWGCMLRYTKVDK